MRGKANLIFSVSIFNQLLRRKGVCFCLFWQGLLRGAEQVRGLQGTLSKTWHAVTFSTQELESHWELFVFSSLFLGTHGGTERKLFSFELPKLLSIWTANTKAGSFRDDSSVIHRRIKTNPASRFVTTAYSSRIDIYLTSRLIRLISGKPVSCVVYLVRGDLK